MQSNKEAFEDMIRKINIMALYLDEHKSKPFDLPGPAEERINRLNRYALLFEGPDPSLRPL